MPLILPETIRGLPCDETNNIAKRKMYEECVVGTNLMKLLSFDWQIGWITSERCVLEHPFLISQTPISRTGREEVWKSRYREDSPTPSLYFVVVEAVLRGFQSGFDLAYRCIRSLLSAVSLRKGCNMAWLRRTSAGRDEYTCGSIHL